MLTRWTATVLHNVSAGKIVLPADKNEVPTSAKMKLQELHMHFLVRFTEGHICHAGMTALKTPREGVWFKGDCPFVNSSWYIQVQFNKGNWQRPWIRYQSTC